MELFLHKIFAFKFIMQSITVDEKQYFMHHEVPFLSGMPISLQLIIIHNMYTFMYTVENLQYVVLQLCFSVCCYYIHLNVHNHMQCATTNVSVLITDQTD